jgi:glycosyltransferase involved in cell wall biosynthesis
MQKNILIIGYNLRFETPKKRSLVSGEIKNANYLLNGFKNHIVKVISVDLYEDIIPKKGELIIQKSSAPGFFRWINESKKINKLICKLDYDTIYLTVPSYLPFLNIRSKAKILITAHGTYWPELLADIQYEKNLLKKVFHLVNGIIQHVIDKIAFKKANLLHSVSDFQIEEMKNSYSSASEKIFSLRNTSDFKLKCENKTVDFMWVGRLAKKKNIVMFDNLLDKFPNSNAIVVGGSDYFTIDELSKKTFEKLSKRDNVECYSDITDVELEKLYSIAKNLIVTSTGYESIPTVIFEGLNCGCNVIAPNSWGVKEIHHEKLYKYIEGDLVDLLDKLSLNKKSDLINKTDFKNWDIVSQEMLEKI